jgi:AcrR family transcriptional regulator
MVYVRCVDETGIGLRARTRRAVQSELLAVAMDLFLSQGFEATTVDQIAVAAGLSRRSFFRYFASKDDALARALFATGEQIAAELAARPGDEAPWQALRRAFDPLLVGMTADSRALAMTRMMLDSAALHASHQQKQASWRQAIAASISPRLPSQLTDDERRLQADALSGAALACLMTAQAEWVASNGQRSLADLLDLTMGAVSPLDT